MLGNAFAIIATVPMSIIEQLENRRKAMTTAELADLLNVTPRQLQKMASGFRIPSFKIGDVIRFDPAQIVEWLKKKQPTQIGRPRRLA